ncbi:MAG: hypothetical protein DFNUSKGM_002290 [Candidatus Fervidibacter sacchari]
MTSSSEGASAFSWQVVTTQKARWVGWLLLLPLAALLCLQSLGIFALAIWSWFVWHNLELVFLCALMSILCFLVTYLVIGRVHDHLATYQVTQDGLIKSSPLRTQRILWEQVVKFRREVAEDVWWLKDSRGRSLLAINWYLLPTDQVTAMIKARLFQHFFQQWETLFANWSAKGKTFRPEPMDFFGEGLAPLICYPTIFAVILDWNTLWKVPLATVLALGAPLVVRRSLSVLTRKVSVQGDWLFVSELFQTTRLHLGSVTEVLPIVTCPLSDGRQELKGLELKSGSVRVRISNELRDFFLLCLYLASKLPSPWNAIVKALAIGAIWHEKEQLFCLILPEVKGSEPEYRRET